MILITTLGRTQFIVLKGALDRRLDLPEVKRLHNVIERADPQRFNRALDGLHAANHHDDRFGREVEDVRNHLQAAHAAHRDVADDEMKRARAERLKRFFSRTGRRTLVIVAEHFAEHAPDLRLVVNHQQARSFIVYFEHQPKLQPKLRQGNRGQYEKAAVSPKVSGFREGTGSGAHAAGANAG